ncbi:reverse transcriptase domain-containing protein, partial [Tanacetum coccineum]
EWMQKLHESTNLNTRNQNASLKNLETHIEQLAKDYQAKAANKVPNPSVGQCKAIFANNKEPTEETAPKGTNELHGVSFISNNNVQVSKEIEEGPLGVLPYLRASVNTMPKSMFNHLKLTNLKETNILVEMADMTKKAPVGIVENVLEKIDKFLFPSDFMIIDMLGDPNETMILGRPFLATIHARIDVFYKEISLGVGEDKIVFDMNGNVHHPAAFVEKVCMINEEQYEGEKGITTMAKSETTAPRLHYYKQLQVLRDDEFKFWPTCDPSSKVCNSGDRIHGLDEQGNIKQWEYNYDDKRRNKKGKEMLFPNLLLIKYRNSKIDDMVRARRYIEWCDENNTPLDYGSTSVPHHALAPRRIINPSNQEDLILRIKSYFPNSLPESGLEEKYYDLPQVCIETFEVKQYSLEEGKSFVCVTKQLEDVLPLGWVNGSRFKGMIRDEMDTRGSVSKGRHRLGLSLT